MRFILIALCLAVASANLTPRNRFNRLIRSIQQEDREDGRYGPQGYRHGDLEEQDLDQDEDEYYQREHKQCSRNQRCSLNLNDDESEYDEQDQDQFRQYRQDEDQFRQYEQREQRFPQDQDDEYRQRRQYRQDEYDQDERPTPFHQRHGRQQQKLRQQQRNQCRPKYQLLQELEQPNAHLAAKLYKQAKQENDDKNTVVSPAALQLALAAIQRGARGETKRQLQRIIGAGLNKHQNRQAHTALQQSLKGQDPIQRQLGKPQQSQIKTTTTIVINQRNRAQQRFIQAVQACLNTQVKKCDFQRQPQQCRQEINQYVAQKTHQKLRQVVPQDAITENTKLVVVSTAQVKARWGSQFRQQQQTKQGRFYPLGSKQPKPVKVLQSQGQFPYHEDEQLQVVGVPTQQQELTLYVIVPKNKDGLNQVEKSHIQDGQQLKQLLEQAEQQRQEVEVELPKFQIKHKLDAKQTLRKQGVRDIFDVDEADLSGINGQPQKEEKHRRYGQRYSEEEEYQRYGDEETRQHQLHVNKLIHQATIKVDERGISAAQPRPGQQRPEEYPEESRFRHQQEDEEDLDEQDEQGQEYYQRQEERQELFEEIFRQGQRRPHHQRQRNHRRHERGQYGEEKRVKANRAFAFALKHNPSNQIVLVGRVVDATQKPRPHQPTFGQRGQQSLNGVDQQ